MTRPEDIRKEIYYWNGFRDAMEIALLKPEKIGTLHSRVIEKIEELKRVLRVYEARELIIESQSRPPEILQEQGGHGNPKKEVRENV